VGLCRKKQRDKKARRGDSSCSNIAGFVSALEQEVLALFRHLNAVTPSAQASIPSTPPTPPPPSGI